MHISLHRDRAAIHGSHTLHVLSPLSIISSPLVTNSMAIIFLSVQHMFNSAIPRGVVASLANTTTESRNRATITLITLGSNMLRPTFNAKIWEIIFET